MPLLLFSVRSSILADVALATYVEQAYALQPPVTCRFFQQGRQRQLSRHRQ